MTAIGLFKYATPAAFKAILTPQNFTNNVSVTCDLAFSVDWGDGSPIDYAANASPSVVPTSPGPVTVTSTTPTFFRNLFNTVTGIAITGAGSLTSLFHASANRGSFENLTLLTSFSIDDTSNVTTFQETWKNCTGLTSFPSIDTSAGTNFQGAWDGCSGLTSFPSITTTSATTFEDTWNGCSGLTSFPAISAALVTTINSAWRDCSGLTSFPAIDFVIATIGTSAWNGCSGLTSFSADVSNIQNFASTWNGCSGLTTFTPNVSVGTNFSNTFRDCTGLTSCGALLTENGTLFTSMFRNCSNLATISAIDTTSNVATVDNQMFVGCTSLTSPDAATQTLLRSPAGFDFN